MKIKFNTNLVVNVVIIGTIIFIISYQLAKLGGFNTHNTANAWENQIKPIDPIIPDSLPHKQYVKLHDSITTMRNLKNGHTFDFGGVSVSIGFIGVSSNVSCDTCNYKWYKSASMFDKYLNEKLRRYYITLPGWKLSVDNQYNYIDDNNFFVEHGQAYLRRAITDTTIIKKDGTVYNKIHIEDVPVKFRYNEFSRSILIPVSSATAVVIKVILYILLFTWFLYGLFLVATFLKFVIDLSKGHAFTKENVWRLKIIAISLLVYQIAVLILNYGMKLIFHDYFTEGIVLNNTSWENAWKILLAGIIFLLLYKAFRQGKLLKEEQDLTV
jgi:hypothetical protein